MSQGWELNMQALQWGGKMNVGLLQDLFVQGFFNWPLMYGLRHVGRV